MQDCINNRQFLVNFCNSKFVENVYLLCIVHNTASHTPHSSFYTVVRFPFTVSIVQRPVQHSGLGELR